MKKILLIGNVTRPEPHRLKAEAEALGHQLDMVTAAMIDTDNAVVTFIGEGAPVGDFFDYDVYLFRGIRKSEERMQQLAVQLAARGKRVVERILATALLPEDKFVRPSKQGHYIVPAYRVLMPEQLHEVEADEYPVVAKRPQSSMGKGVAKISTAAELLAFAHVAGGPIIVQTYYEIVFDVRVIVVGDTVVGGFARYKKTPTDFLTTRARGVRERIAVSPAMAEAAKEAKELHGLEIAGVDMFLVDGVPHILEVNASPQFKIFERKTEQNVAKLIIEHICLD